MNVNMVEHLDEHDSRVSSWDYRESVLKVQPLVKMWTAVTGDIMDELRVARAALSNQGARTDLGPNVPTWSRYCEDIGISRRHANRLLEDPKPRRLLEEPRATKAERINRVYADIMEDQRQIVKAAIDIGELYTRQKEELEPGEFLSWIREYHPPEAFEAEEYMRLYRQRHSIELSLEPSDPFFLDLVEVFRRAEEFEKGSAGITGVISEETPAAGLRVL